MPSKPANSINHSGASGIVRFNGTSTFSTEALSQYAIIIGNAANPVTNIAPTSTTGIPIVSQGSSAQPIFGTAVVAGGGTGNTSQAAYSIVCGGTTTTNPFQAINPVAAGQMLLSNGTSALPVWANQKFYLIQSQSASASATLDFTATLGYTSIMICLEKIVPATNTDVFSILQSSDGSTWQNTDYISGFLYNDYDSTTLNNANATTSFIISGPESTASINGISGYIMCSNINTALNISITGNITYFDTTLNKVSGGIVFGTGNTSITSLRFLFSTGNIASGIITMFGLSQT